MTRYLLSTHTEDEEREPTSEEQMREGFQRLATIEEEMSASGAWVFSARLHGPETATVVRVAGGDVPPPTVRSRSRRSTSPAST